MKYVYLDWNIFDRIEKIGSLDKEQQIIYSNIEKLISDRIIICPYSNAHINDLLRGYNKTPDFIPKHLETLERLTNNLCIVQYWGNPFTTWHYRDVKDFFNSAIEESEEISKSFIDLAGERIKDDETGLLEKLLDLLRLLPVPKNFKDIYKANQIFSLMFPRTKNNMNVLSMCEDLYDFTFKVKKDFSLYKSLKTYINQSRIRLKDQQKYFKEIDKSLSEVPAHLTFDESLEKYEPKTKTSENPAYQKITDTYFKIDIKGYKSDEKFANLIDDSLHVFYGAQCEFFVTIDDKCHYKAVETYQKLGIATRALKPTEFVNLILT